MARAHDTEVSVVQCGDRGDVETFGDCDDARVNHTQIEIVILLEQLDDPVPIIGREIDESYLRCRDYRRNATSAATPSRDEISQLVSTTTGAGTTSWSVIRDRATPSTGRDPDHCGRRRRTGRRCRRQSRVLGRLLRVGITHDLMVSPPDRLCSAGFADADERQRLLSVGRGLSGQPVGQLSNYDVDADAPAFGFCPQARQTRQGVRWSRSFRQCTKRQWSDATTNAMIASHRNLTDAVKRNGNGRHALGPKPNLTSTNWYRQRHEGQPGGGF